MSSPSHTMRCPARIQRPLCTALLAGASLACAHGPPAKPIWFDQLSFDSCAELGVGAGAPEGGQMPEGHFTLWMSVAADGTVPAAFFHDTTGFIQAPNLRCMAGIATEARALPQAADGIRPVYLNCEIDRRGGRPHPRLRCPIIDTQLVEQPLDPALAQATLSFAPWASAAQRGWGEAYAGSHGDAVREFRQALASDPQDVLALRGLAQSLAAGKLDLAEAHAAGAKAAQLAPRTSGAHEALLAVCLAQQDDACIASEQLEMSRNPGAAERIFSHRELDDELRAAAARSLHESDAPTSGELILAPNDMARTSLGRARSLNIDLREPQQPGQERIPIVFITGMGGGLRDFAPLLEHASLDRRALAIEPPGLGFSEAPRENLYELAPILEDMGKVLDSLSIDRCILVGHGLGATLAVALAKRRKAAGLLLIDPLGDLTQLEPTEKKRAREDLAAPELLATFDLNVHTLLRGAKPSTERLVLREAHMLRPEAAIGYFSLALQEPVAKDLRELAVPVRLMRSRFDDEPIALAALLAKLPVKRVENTSSWIMLDAPELASHELDLLLTTVEKSP